MAVYSSNFRYSFCSADDDGSHVYFLSNENAPRYKLLSVDIASTSFKRETFVEEEDAVLKSASLVNGKYFALVYRRMVNNFKHVLLLLYP